LDASLHQTPLFQRLAPAQRILIAGAGGGFDVLSGLPLFLTLKALGKTVYLANLTFTYVGATDAKPIGLVYFAVDDGTRVFSEKQIFYGDRWAIKSQAAIRMLELVNSALKGRKASRGRSHRERAD